MVAWDQQVLMEPLGLNEQGSPTRLPLSSSSKANLSPYSAEATPVPDMQFSAVSNGCEDSRQRPARQWQGRQQRTSPTGAVAPYPTRRQSRLARASNGRAEEVPELADVFGLLSQLQAAESQASSVSATVENLTHNAFCLACTVIGASVGVISGLWSGVTDSLPSFRSSYHSRP